MTYSIYFFASKMEQLCQQVASDETLADRVVRRVQEQRNPPQATLQGISQRVESARRGPWPSPADGLDFEVFLWMLDILAERIVINLLTDFRHFSLWEETGLGPVFAETPCPFPVPHSPDPLPKVGYLPHERMPRLLTECASSPEPADPYSRAARIELLEVIESLASDELDLLAIVQ